MLNTITLAPCEQVAVAVSDWMRRETASRQETSVTEQERTEHIDHDRLIVETLDSTVKTKSLAGSFATSFGATIPIKKVDVTATAGGGISGSVSTQQVAASTTNRLAEHITQAATLVMSYRSSVVFQATASEQRRYQTRFVRNHNRCHTLTLMYYQVNRNYRVVTDYKGERDAIFIQYPNIDFDARRAYCNATVLRETLLDKSLDECFDRIGDALFCCEQDSPGDDIRMDSITLTLDVAQIVRVSDLSVTLLTANGPIQLPQISTFGWSNGTHSATLTFQAPVDPSIVMGVLITVTRSGSPGNLGGFGSMLVLNQLTVAYHAIGVTKPLTLYSSQQAFMIIHTWSAEVKPELPSTVPDHNECVRTSCCIQKLLGHLNCHKRYYNSVVWLNEDPNDRVMRWSCCRGSDGAVDLIGLIENMPIAVYGDFVVFPVAGSPLVDDPSVPPISRLVTIPTPGVYSEGILGQCDTCEIVDPQRFTDWKCDEVKSEIPDFPDPQTGVKPGDLKPETVTNLITLASVPTAPDSIIKALLESLLSGAKSGSEESKALLDKLFDLLKETLTKASPGAAPAK